MAENEEKVQSDFIIERIKERPVNKKKLLQRTIITISLAGVFGLVACLTFLLLQPVFSNLLYPQEEPEVVVFPEETDEMLPEEMVIEDDVNNENLTETVESVLAQGGKIEEVLGKWVLNRNNYYQLYNAMNNYTKELYRAMVTVTGVSSDKDWLNNTVENSMQVSGTVIANNGIEFLILADSTLLSGADSIWVTFYNERRAEATLKQKDVATGLAVYAVPLDIVPEEMWGLVEIAPLGTTSSGIAVGNPVVAMGSPMGVKGSVQYGMITASDVTWNTTDANYKLFYTDMFGCETSSGAIFNLQGQMVGIITHDKAGDQAFLSAMGIPELRNTITRMCNGNPEPYLGIKGISVTASANALDGVPFGAYVREVEMDSPAMLAGIQSGDIIVNIGVLNIQRFEDYSNVISKSKPGQVLKLVVKRQVQDGYKDVIFQVTVSGHTLQ
ncbi:MAG: serine protease [Lachnospiraceae bacterium]|nr:serine protease [Lachnospiraceae bacterium]